MLRTIFLVQLRWSPDSEVFSHLSSFDLERIWTPTTTSLMKKQGRKRSHNFGGGSPIFGSVVWEYVNVGFGEVNESGGSRNKRGIGSCGGLTRAVMVTASGHIRYWRAEMCNLDLYQYMFIMDKSRPKDANLLAQSHVVITTTYGVLASEFSIENSKDNGGLYSVKLVLVEAHTIKSSKSQLSIAAAALVAGRRWCLTGTPIQSTPANWAWWNKLIQKPFEEGDERGLKLVQSILKTIMLGRTKFSTDCEGRPILVLPPADIEVIYRELTEAEKDFYEALFKRSKVKFDQFVE